MSTKKIIIFYDLTIMNKTKETSTFSKNLKRIRKERGLSQYDLADITGISKRMIGHYETHVTEPPLDKIEIIARALKVNISELLYNDALISNSEIDISKFDTRSLKKLQDILELPPNDRADIYRLLNKLIRKNKLEQEKKQLADSKK
jgi:transcriptional regulator with XRE-family HTH domain